MPGKPPMTVDQCNCFTVRKAARQISRLYDGHLQPAGLRITQFLILATLHEKGSAAVNELAERLDIERTAMGKMATVLERDGFAKITPSPADARSRVVQLTREGTRLYERALPLWLAAQREFAALNGASRVSGIRSHLQAMAVGDLAGAPD